MTDTTPQFTPPGMTVGAFVEKNKDQLRLDAGSASAGLERLIARKRLQKLGMALAGFTDYLQPGRVYVFGNTELAYFNSQPPERQERILAGLAPRRLDCLLVTNNLLLPPPLAAFIAGQGTPVVLTPLDSSSAIHRFSEFLELELASSQIVHGVLMDVFGVGVLIGGESGIGKSECALELILKGHRLVADDVVELRNVGDKHLLGEAPANVRELLELRGIGILNVREMFGVSAIARRKEVACHIQLERWTPERSCERLGLEWDRKRFFEIDVPGLVIPVAPGRNLSVLVEVACRVFLLKTYGLRPWGNPGGLLQPGDVFPLDNGGEP